MNKEHDNTISQEDANVLHDILCDYRDWVEGNYLEHTPEAPFEMGWSGKPEELWTAAQLRIFERFGATPFLGNRYTENS